MNLVQSRSRISIQVSSTCFSGGLYVCSEHSRCNAVILGSLFSDIFLYSNFHFVTPDGKIDASKFYETSEYPQYSELHWNWPEKLAQNNEVTKAEILKNPTLKIRLSVKTFTVDKDLIKLNKMGPDSFCQCAIYSAYYRKHKKIVNSYQPASLMFFKLGRTENNRPLSVPKMNFVEGMEDKSLSREEKINLLRKSANITMSRTELQLLPVGLIDICLDSMSLQRSANLWIFLVEFLLQLSKFQSVTNNCCM